MGRLMALAALSLGLVAFAGAASAQSWTPEQQELFPISATVTGHYTDVLIKGNGKWLFIAWAGGDDPRN